MNSRETGGSHYITTKDVTTAKEDQLYQVEYSVSDQSNITNVIWRLVTGADWLHINSENGILNGTPNNLDVGQAFINISVWDGTELLDSHGFILTIENERPYILTHHKLNATQGQLYWMDYVSDDDGQGNITWQISAKDCPWLSIDPKTGVLQGVPSNNDIGLHYVNIWVIDGNGGSGQSGIYLVVENANDLPEITSSPVDAAFVDLIYRYEVDTKDIDKGDIVRLELIENPVGMVLKGNVIEWRPARGQEGPQKVVLGARDRADGRSTQTFYITVRPHLFLAVHRPCDGENVTGRMTVHGTVLGPDNVAVHVEIDGTGGSLAKGNRTWNYVINTKKLENGNHTLRISATWQDYSTDGLEISFRVENAPRAQRAPGFPSILWAIAIMVALWISRRGVLVRKGGR